MALDSREKGASPGPSGKKPKEASPEKAKAPQPVLLYKILEERLVLTLPEAQAKDPVIRRLNAELCQAKALSDPESYLSKVLERESGISTTLDTGLSLPHARLDSVRDFHAVLGLLPKGLPDPQQPDILIKAVLLFFSPSDPAYFQRHLQFLRHVATLFQPSLIDQLVECQTPREALAVLRAKES